MRFSLCCGREAAGGETPRPLRFLGRQVYAGLIVVLVSAMRHGLKPEQVRRLRQRWD
ncbi:MAG: hypothetical protein HS113_01450 [Verrucomicrobiales bacterium]|nr:hypothetical protein [Verrucomicrobiales bacterium]